MAVRQPVTYAASALTTMTYSAPAPASMTYTAPALANMVHGAPAVEQYASMMAHAAPRRTVQQPVTAATDWVSPACDFLLWEDMGGGAEVFPFPMSLF